MSYNFKPGGQVGKSLSFNIELLPINVKQEIKKGAVVRYRGEKYRIESIKSVAMKDGGVIVHGKWRPAE